MNKCRHCGAKLTRLNTDICPFCGGLKPLEGNEYMTEDLTKTLQKVEIEEVKYKSKIAALVLAVTLGIFGANEFYLGYKKAGFILVGVTVVLAITVTLLYIFVLQNVLIILIPALLYEVLLIIQGVSYLTSGKKDSRGELLK